MSPARAQAGAVALAGGIALWLAADAGVAGPAAVPDLLRGLLAAAGLFWLCGVALTRRLLPGASWPLLALPVGAAASSLALTVLGLARLPFELSLGLVLATGAASAAFSLRGARPHRPGAASAPLVAIAALGAIAIALALVPALRSGFATVPGENPDAHLVTGTALLFQEAPPTATRVELPVDEVPDVWRSKYPIFYALAGTATLSGLDPIEAFPAVSALLVGMAVAGFGLFALTGLRAPPLAAVCVAAVLALDAAVLHVALHPYWNQMWGLAMLPFALLLGWLAVRERSRGAAVLLVLVLVLAVFAYPLMLPYPLVAIGGYALGLRRLPALPRWSPRRWALLAAGSLLVFAVPLYGVAEKIGSAAAQFVDPSPDLSAWTGDVVDFIAIEAFVSLRGGPIAFATVCALALVGLWRALDRSAALALGALLALCAIAGVRFRTIEFGAYFDFKHLSFVAPLLLTLAVVALSWLVSLRRSAVVAGTAAAFAAFVVLSTLEVREELRRTFDQVTPAMVELREWSDRLPPGASVRIDIPPSGVQLWAGYFLADHPLTAPAPVFGTTYPHAPRGTRADFALSVHEFEDPGGRVIPIPPILGAADPPLLRNEQFVLRRVPRPSGPETASRRMVPGIPSPQPRP